MKLFTCRGCGQVLNFENTKCERCGHRLGFIPEEFALIALDPDGDHWRPLGQPLRSLRFCANTRYDACNWLVPADAKEPYCVACRHNRTVPDLSGIANVTRWRKLEFAKHRLFYTLLRLNLPLTTRALDPAHGLAFDFLADPPSSNVPRIMTGHDNGVITIALKEADDAEREKRRAELGEPYRTPLGHFRHEVGHYFWDLLVRDGGYLEEFRALFGDDRQDYGLALQTHYRNGAPPNWHEHFISAYGTAHPWEDFAETWAHYLHMVDTLETAHAFGMSVSPRVAKDESLTAAVDFDPHRARDIHRLIETWLPISFAVNSLNRAMGQPDLYPFVLPAAVIDKLAFMVRIVHERKAQAM
jgi:hypothetical protein